MSAGTDWASHPRAIDTTSGAHQQTPTPASPDGPESASSHDLDIPEKDWDIPFTEGSWLADHFEDVLAEERDLIIIVDDYYGRRGTGKTVASMQLAHGMDQNEGITWDKTSLEPEAIRNAYQGEDQKSGLVLDEAEVGASNRDAMSKTNQALREIMSMGRVEQKYVVVNAPLRGFIDSDLQKLADVWISMVRRGLGLVHHLKWETYSGTLLTPAKQWIEFDDIPTGTQRRQVYNRLTEEKRKRIKGDDGSGFIAREDHREELEQVRNDVRTDTREEVVADLMRHPSIGPEVTQSDVADALGMSQSWVSNVT